MTLRALILWLSLSSSATAEGLTGSFLDALMTPGADAAGLVMALTAQGFKADNVASAGPDALPEGILDPAYTYLRADVLPQTGRGPLILLECSRIGPGMLPHLPSGAPSAGVMALPVVPLLQWADTVDFLPQAATQLRCRADILPVAGDGDPIALPSRDEVTEALAARFATLATGPLDEGLNPDRVTLTGETADPAIPGAARSVRYEHRDDGALHSLDLILHEGPSGG